MTEHLKSVGVTLKMYNIEGLFKVVNWYANGAFTIFASELLLS